MIVVFSPQRTNCEIVGGIMGGMLAVLWRLVAGEGSKGCQGHTLDTH